jgi:hypothetical protein
MSFVTLFQICDSDNNSSISDKLNSASSSESSELNSDESEIPLPPPLAKRLRIEASQQVPDVHSPLWKVTTTRQVGGRAAAINILRVRPGLTAYSRGVSTPLEAWKLLMDDGCLRHIRRCTEEFAALSDGNWKMSNKELDAFIGLLYLRGVMNQKNFPLSKLWSADMGNAAFRNTMTRDRFEELKKNIRFDARSTRSERLMSDKFALMSWILDRLVENSQKCYIPEECLTIDEQLFPTKARCRFTQYMPNKPDKFGIKFWILCEVRSKYCLCIIPYLGKDEGRVDCLGTHVVMKLMTPYFGLGYTVTTDNFFTSPDLAQKLLAKHCSIVGTVRSNRRDLPSTTGSLPLHDSVFYEQGGMNLVAYQAKRTKTVYLLSTMHKGACRQEDDKKKPDSILYYNQNKCGVDMMDSMCRQLSTKAGCRRWSLAVFFNLLDIAGINAWIIFRKATGSNMSRRQFLLQLSQQLIQAKVDESAPQLLLTPSIGTKVLSARVTCGVKVVCNRNRTTSQCCQCHLPVCGQCLAGVCLKCYTP